jgi:hypothetical protein
VTAVPPPPHLAPAPPVEYWAYDIETYPNVFTVVAIRIDSGEQRVFEMSPRRNDAVGIYTFIHELASRKAVMVGFNSVGFDYPVLHHCMTTGNLTAANAYAKAQAIIDSQGDDDRWTHMVWASDMIVPQLDLYKIHHFDNRAKSTGLKALEFAMRSESIEDLPFPVGVDLTDEQIDTLLTYNIHDVTETIAFFHHSRSMIDFRAELTAKYGVDFTNHNDTKIGKDYFIMKLEEAGVPCFDRSTGRKVPRQTFRHDGIPLGQIIFPNIRFEHPEFNRVLEYLRGITIRDTKADPQLKELSATIDGFQFDYGTGGIHGSVRNRIIRSSDTHVILDVDVASMYPNIAIANRVFPEHLSERFCDIYGDLYEQRKSYKKGTAENAMLKLALNGVYGDSNNIYSPFYDPQYTMSITINGQLQLSMLAERLMRHGEIIQANTDGVTLLVPRDNVGAFRAACAEWEAITGLQLEEAEYRLMALRDVNNYLAVSADGKIKRKGAYEYEMDWHQDPSSLIVAKAVEAALVDGVTVEEVIENHFDPFDFVLRAKVPRSSRLETTTGEVLQNTTRYYIANDGPSLVKIMPPLAKKGPDAPERRIGISVGWPVAICNRMSDFRWDRLNRGYYVKEARKLLDVLGG